MAGVYEMAVREYDGDSMLLEYTQTEEKNDRLIDLMKKQFRNRIEIVRGGSVAITSAEGAADEKSDSGGQCLRCS